MCLAAGVDMLLAARWWWTAWSASYVSKHPRTIAQKKQEETHPNLSPNLSPNPIPHPTPKPKPKPKPIPKPNPKPDPNCISCELW